MKIQTIFLTMMLIALTAHSSAAANAFGLDRVNFFANTDLQKTEQNVQPSDLKQLEETEKQAQQQSRAEPIFQKDGQIGEYVAPKPVREFRDNPTEETGRRYLEWATEYIEKHIKSEAILKKLTKDLVASHDDSKNTYTPQKPNTNISYMGFFLLKGCPYCEQQKPLISRILKERPDIAVDVYTVNYSQADIDRLPFPAKDDGGLSKTIGFNRYPTTIAIDTAGQRSVINGVLSNELMNSLLPKRGAL